MSTFTFSSVPTSLELRDMPHERPAAGAAAATGPAPLPRLVGSIPFSVQNTPKDSDQNTPKGSDQNTNKRFVRTGRFCVVPGPGMQASWLSFKDAPPTSPGLLELDLETGATSTVTLLVTIPPDAPPGNYHFNIRAINTADTDNDVAESPAVSFTVPERTPAAVPPKRAFPWWAVAAGVAFLILAGGGAWWAFPSDSEVTVPVVLGKDVAAAVTLLNDANLKPVVTGWTPSPQAPATVLASKPAAGESAKKNAPVELTLAIPPNTPDPCIRRDLATSIKTLCNRSPLTLSAVRNPAFSATLLEAIKPR